MVTKRLQTRSPGLILGAFCTIFRARPAGTGLGAKFGRKPAKDQIEIIIVITYSKRRWEDLRAVWRRIVGCWQRRLAGCQDVFGAEDDEAEVGSRPAHTSMAAALAKALGGVISQVISGVSPVISGISPVIRGPSGPKLGRLAPNLGST